MNVFSKLKVYGENWKVINVRKFGEEEIAEIDSVEVVPSNYGTSVCFFLKNNKGRAFVPVSRDSSLQIGDTVELDQLRLVELERGGMTITRVDLAKEAF